MELIKTYKVKKSSRNKLTKKQLTELRKRKYFLFERSWRQFIERLNYLKALYHTNTDLYKYDMERIKNLHKIANKCFCKELFWIGMEDEILPDIICTKRESRSVKLSFTKVDAILMGKWKYKIRQHSNVKVCCLIFKPINK